MGTAKKVRWHFLLAASLVLGQALPVAAMPITYQFESGSVDFGLAPSRHWLARYLHPLPFPCSWLVWLA